MAKLLFCFMDLADEINESFSGLRHALLWPVSELELSHCSGLTVLRGEGRTQPEKEPGGSGGARATAASVMGFPERKNKRGEEKHLRNIFS